MEPEVVHVAGVVGSHEGVGVTRVLQAESVAKLMGGHNPQIGAPRRVFCPFLRLVEMSAPILREERMRQCSAFVKEEAVENVESL